MAYKSMEIRNLFLLTMIVTMMFLASTVVQSQGNNAPIQNIDDELPLVKFRDISNQSGLGVNIENWEQDKTDVESFTPGVSWGDYDNDGWIDIFITANYDPSDLNSTAKPHLMHNNGDGTFSDVTEFANVGNAGHSTVSQWVDYDLDGDLDLYSLNWGIYIDKINTAYTETNVLYQNNGNGTFTDVTRDAELFGGLVEGLGPEPGTFERSELGRADITASGLSSGAQILHDSPYGTGMSWAALWFDHNLDGYPDVFIANDFGISPLYINEGDGTFKMHTVEAGLDLPGTGMGVDAGDYDQDGDLDLCQSNFGPEYIWNKKDEDSYQQVVNTDKGGQSGFFAAGAVQTTWVCEWFDYDNDGDVDLFLSSGAVSAYIPKRENIMYLNVGDWSDDEGNFVDVLQDVGL